MARLNDSFLQDLYSPQRLWYYKDAITKSWRVLRRCAKFPSRLNPCFCM